jgi:hypothetical protein
VTKTVHRFPDLLLKLGVTEDVHIFPRFEQILSEG